MIRDYYEEQIAEQKQIEDFLCTKVQIISDN
jgi:hypothetical protein